MRKFFLKIIIIFIGLTLIPMMPEENQINTLTTTIIQTFSTPQINEDEEYIKLTVKEAESWVTNPGGPKLPMFTKTLEFPVGTEIKKIKITHSETKTLSISKKIKPVSIPTSLSDNKPMLEEEINHEIYNSNNIYPSDLFTYETGMGINKKGEQTLFVFIKAIPARYTPSSNNLEYIENIQFEINYEQSKYNTPRPCIYDLLIITPTEYKENLTKLVQHKNYYGIKTSLTTLDTIVVFMLY